jgi:hypothetical protein
MEKVFNSGVNPVHSGLYVVDRGEKLGTPYRWFDAESQEWSRCEYLMEDVMQAKGKTGALGFLPWRGPVKVLTPKATKEVSVVELMDSVGMDITGTKPVKVAKVKAPKTVKVAKVKVAKASTKETFADGTIVFRADRQKYMAWFGSKSEAARPTVDAAKAFLTKKYGITEFVVIDNK